LLKFKKHIGLFLLLTFSVSLLMNSSVSLYHLFQIQDGTEWETRTVYCEAGHIVESPKDLSYHGTLSAHEQPEKDDHVMLVNNCNTSLQMIPADEIRLTRTESESDQGHDFILGASQLFVHAISDPPQSA
jgi:hypothetical protein